MNTPTLGLNGYMGPTLGYLEPQGKDCAQAISFSTPAYAELPQALFWGVSPEVLCTKRSPDGFLFQSIFTYSHPDRMILERSPIYSLPQYVK